MASNDPVPFEPRDRSPCRGQPLSSCYSDFVTAMRLVKLLLVTTAVLLVGFLPSADILAFGLHQHTVASPERSLDLPDSETTEALPVSHHCELSVSVGDRVVIAELPVSVVTFAAPPEHHVPAPQHSLIVPLTPPRS